MAQATADFEVGVHGNNVETTDAGSATAWDNVTRSGASTIVYSNVHAAHGGLGAKYNNGAGSACWTEWTTGIGTLTDWYGRLYMYWSSLPATNPPTVLQALDGGATGFQFRLNTSGLITVFYNTGSDTMSTAISTGQFVRLEWHAIHSTTVGQIEIKLFNSPDSTTPTETFTSAANKNTLTDCDQIRFGQVAIADSGQEYWLDDLVAGATSYPGPAVAAAVPTLRTVQSNLRW